MVISVEVPKDSNSAKSGAAPAQCDGRPPPPHPPGGQVRQYCMQVLLMQTMLLFIAGD